MQWHEKNVRIIYRVPTALFVSDTKFKRPVSQQGNKYATHCLPLKRQFIIRGQTPHHFVCQNRLDSYSEHYKGKICHHSTKYLHTYKRHFYRLQALDSSDIQ